MRARERANIWPIISVIVIALVVLILPVAIHHRQVSARMATIDAQVTIGDYKSALTSSRDAPMYRWPDSEVPRTAERLRDASALAIAASVFVGQGVTSGHTPQNVGEITKGIAIRQLIPTEWLTNQSGVLQTAHGTLHIRYSPSSLSVEVISMPSAHVDGPGLLIRIPDVENTAVGPRYFESMNVDSIIYPNPFAPIPELISVGWQQRPFRQTQAEVRNREQ